MFPVSPALWLDSLPLKKGKLPFSLEIMSSSQNRTRMVQRTVMYPSHRDTIRVLPSLPIMFFTGKGSIWDRVLQLALSSLWETGPQPLLDSQDFNISEGHRPVILQTHSYFRPEVLCSCVHNYQCFFFTLFTQHHLNDYDILLLGNKNLGKSVSLGRGHF